ncbi:helix-turn-helix domain-containing protein [Roseibium sp. RKSG952]|uniref:helix-turn-helix domain-containing protein n=1 Tax=Roseibium sp. RKSG952 TaxID=2529384 RepID=UPI0012BD68AC|nr:helix-turn-helix domain-containing protein [Roseibium sp. RKSG952]MTH96660.1 hypothetical protein [Roseibium sp. RKSG952]
MIPIIQLEIAACGRFGVSPSLFHSSSCGGDLSAARRVAWWLAHRLNGWSLASIARDHGGTNPSTVIAAMCRLRRDFNEHNSVARDARDLLAIFQELDTWRNKA